MLFTILLINTIIYANAAFKMSNNETLIKPKESTDFSFTLPDVVKDYVRVAQLGLGCQASEEGLELLLHKLVTSTEKKSRVFSYLVLAPEKSKSRSCKSSILFWFSMFSSSYVQYFCVGASSLLGPILHSIVYVQFSTLGYLR